MASLLDRLRSLVSRSAAGDRRRIAALAKRLGVPHGDAARIYARSREIGFGAAMLERDAQCGESEGDEG